LILSTKVLRFADFDRLIRVIVLTGEGKSFCAGGDIKAMEEQSGMFEGESNELRMRYMYGIQQIPKCIEEISTPLIALVNGAAIGAGCDLAMMCDLRVGGSKANLEKPLLAWVLCPETGEHFFFNELWATRRPCKCF
jgi:2-(1,2-epoxy-1,2-dihydrophenyl)acetyl-CoA isomerase